MHLFKKKFPLILILLWIVFYCGSAFAVNNQILTTKFIINVSQDYFDINTPVDLSIMAVDSTGNIIKNYSWDIFIEVAWELDPELDYIVPSDWLYTFTTWNQWYAVFTWWLVIKKSWTYTILVEDIQNPTSKWLYEITVNDSSATSTIDNTTTTYNNLNLETLSTEDIIHWMYDNSLSDYSNSDSFKPTKNIRRDEAAKFITKFSQTFLQQRWQENSICYMFNDIPTKNKLRQYIIQSCELWYMKWKNNKFNPDWYLSNAQAIAIIIRMYWWMSYEPESDRSKNYYQTADDIGILDGLELSDRSKSISRWDFATLLYKIHQIIWNWNLLQDDQSTYLQDNTFTDALSSWLDTMFNVMFDFLGLKINSHSGLNNDFISKVSWCLSWSANITETNFDMIWINFYIKMYREIRWLESNQCKIYQRIDNVVVNISSWQLQNAIASWHSQQEINQQLAEMQTAMKESIGKDGICKYTTWDYIIQLQNELSWNFYPIPDAASSSESCTWSLFEE